MPNSHRLQIGVIGFGHWGPNHIRVLSQMRDCTVVGVAETSKERLVAVGEMFPHIRGFNDYRELLGDAQVDAVVVVTPTNTHFSIVSDALSAGKHVLCEKPLCTDSFEGEELVKLAKSKNLILMVGHVFLFNAGILKVKQLLEAGELGSIRHISAVRTNLGPFRSDVNAAWDLASHDIAIFNWLLEGEPIETRAMGAAFLQAGIEDVVNISMKYPGNILALIQCSWLDPKKVRQMTIVGSKRMVTWDDLALSNPVAIYEKTVATDREVTDYGEFLRLSMLDGDVRLPLVQSAEPLRAQDLAFIRAINEGKSPRSDGAFGVGVVRVLEKVSRALASTDSSS